MKFYEILNFKGHLNRIISSKVKAIWRNGWVLPIAGVESERVCACSLHSRLVYNYVLNTFFMIF